MRAALLAPAVALQFLSVIPVRLPRSLPETAFPNAVAWFPLVGAFIGALVAGADALLDRILPLTVASALDLVLLAALSGGLHLDGLADAADGLLGNLPRERRLEVMREGGIGAFGVAAVGLVLLLEFAALTSLGPVARFAALVATLSLSRWSMGLLLWAFPYARLQGAGSPFRSGLGWPHLLAGTLLGLLVAGASFAWVGLLLVAMSGGIALLVGLLALRRVGGCTGDVYGAGGELAFAVTLVALAAITR